MALNVKRITASSAKNILLMGRAGSSKTTTVLSFPVPILLPVESGLPDDVEADAFDIPKNAAEVMQALRALAKEQHDYKTLIVDTVSMFERLWWAALTGPGGEMPLKDALDFGKGDAAVERLYVEPFQNALDHLRVRKGMNVVLNCHVDQQRVKPPKGAEFDVLKPKLRRRAQALLSERSYAVLYLDREEKRGGATVTLYSRGVPGVETKSRIALPDRLVIPPSGAYDVLAPYFARGDKPAAPAINSAAETRVEDDGGDVPPPDAEPEPAGKAKGAAKKAAKKARDRGREHVAQDIEDAGERAANGNGADPDGDPLFGNLEADQQVEAPF